MSWRIALLLPLLMLCGPGWAQSPPLFRISIIDVPGDAVEGPLAVAINDDGVVAGQVAVPKDGGRNPRRVVFRWAAGGVAELMPEGRDGAYMATAGGVDARGAVIGTVYKPQRSPRAVWWDRGVQVRDLQPFRNGVETRATGINAHGDVVGLEFDYSVVFRPQAMFWPRGGPLVNLGALSTQELITYSVNRWGQVVGTQYGTIPMRGFIWSADSGFHLFGPLPGSGESGYVAANAINDDGIVVGYGQLEVDAPRQMFRWTVANGFDVIALPPGFEPFGPLQISIDGWIVGNGRIPGNGYRPFLWTETSGFNFVDDLIDPADPWREKIKLESLSDINAGGTIVGVGAFDGRKVPVVLTREESPVRPSN